MRKQSRFPKPLVSFSHLAGGNYGTVDILAQSRSELELRLGPDFVRFARPTAEKLLEAIQRFLDLEHEPDHDRDDDDADDEDKVIDAVIVAHVREHDRPSTRESERDARARRRT